MGVVSVANLFTDRRCKTTVRGSILAMHLESAAFLGHMAHQEPNESSGHCEPRVLKPLTGGFWLALSANKSDAPNTRVFF
jgi:hypothetical protein